MQPAAGPGEQRGDQPLLGQHGVQHDLGVEGVFLPHAVLQHGLGVRGDGGVGAARPGRRGCHPGEVIGAEPVQQRGRAGSGGRCPEEGENVTSFHLRCPLCQGLDQVIALVRPANTRAAATVRRIGMEWVGETEKYHGLRLQEFRLRPVDLAGTGSR